MQTINKRNIRYFKFKKKNTKRQKKYVLNIISNNIITHGACLNKTIRQYLKRETSVCIQNTEVSSFKNVIQLGFEPRTPTLKVLCSTS